MTRRSPMQRDGGRVAITLLVIAAVVALAAAITWYMRANSEVVTEERYRGIGHKIQTGSQFRRYKLAQTLLDELNYNAQRGTATISQLLIQLKPNDTLILLERSSNLPPTQAEDLLEWVESGGHLIVEAYEYQDDEPVESSEDEGGEKLAEPLLEPFGIEAHIANELNSDSAVTFLLPRQGELKAGFGWDGYVLRSTQTPDWKVDATLDETPGNHLLSYRHGRGRLTAISDGTLFVDNRLHQYDHAALLNALLTQHTGIEEGRTWLLWQLPQERLFSWIKRHLMPTVLTLIVALLLWLFWAAFRIGPIRHLQPVGRRALTEHLLAAGQLFWSPGRKFKGTNGRAELLSAARWGVLKDIQKHHTAWPQLKRQEQLHWLAERCDLTPEILNMALFADEPLEERGFTLIMRHLQKIRGSLLHPKNDNTTLSGSR